MGMANDLTYQSYNFVARAARLPPQGTIIRAQRGSTTCPEGFELISSKRDCFQAARELGAMWDSWGKWKGPSCAYINSKGERRFGHYDNVVYFNDRKPES